MSPSPSSAVAPPPSPLGATDGTAGTSQARAAFERNYVERQQAQLRSVSDPDRYGHYLNMGYWGGGARTHDEAGQCLAQLIAETVRMSPQDTVLDVGCGYGTEVLFWAGQFKPKRLTAIDIDADLLAGARARAEAAQLADVIDFKVASALDMPFPDGSFDAVVSIESPMVFMSRDAFFRNACRVLRAGGRFVTSDLIGRNGRRPRHRTHGPDHVTSPAEYARKLTAAGFTDVCVGSIRDDVIVGGNRFHADERKTLRALAQYVFRHYTASRLDYVIASATKPLA